MDMYTDLIIKPILTEKMAIMEERENKYAFLVNINANKTEIKKAIESSGHNNLTPDSLIGHGIPNFESAHQILENTNYTGITSNIKAYPNPSDGNITISSHIPIKEISIYDTRGIKVVTIKTNSEIIKLDLNYLSSGLYFIKGKNQNNVKNVKIKIL